MHQIQLLWEKHILRFLLKISWLLAMQFSTRDVCCTLSCGRTVKPLFYRLHEVETVGLSVWFPFMICLGWWAGTTGPPRIPPSQGCEHLSVMPLFRKCYVPKNHKNTLKNEANLYRISPCVRVRNFIQKDWSSATLISDKRSLRFNVWALLLVCWKSCYIPGVDELISTRLDL